MDSYTFMEIRAIAQAEIESRRKIAKLRDELCQKIASIKSHMEMISDGKDGRPLIGTIKFSQLQSMSNWSPSYHFVEYQAKAVQKALLNCNTLKQLIKCVKEMILHKKVSFSAYEPIYLNDETMKVIKESEIGQFIIANFKNEIKSV